MLNDNTGCSRLPCTPSFINMTADIIGSLLLIEDAAKAPELFKKSANVFVRMAEEEVTGSAAYIKDFTPEDLDNFKAVDDEPVEA